MSDKPDTRGMEYLQSLPRRWVTLYVPLGVFLFVLLFPFYWMVMTSFKPNEELVSKAANPFWIVHPTLAHFEKLLFRTDYPLWLWNTIVVSTQNAHAVHLSNADGTQMSAEVSNNVISGGAIPILIENMGKGCTDRVSAQLTWAREQGLIPWQWVADDTRRIERQPA